MGELNRTEILAAIDNAASAGNERQTPLMIRDHFAIVGKKRRAAAFEIVRRFLEYVPDDATVLELREAVDPSHE